MVQSGDRDLIGAYARGHVLVSGIGLPMFQAPNLEIAYRSALDAAELDARSSLLALFESEIKRLVSNEHYRSLLKVTERSEGTVPPGRRVKETPPDVFARAQSSSPSVDIVMRFELFGPNGVLTPLVQQVAPQLMLSERGVAQFGDASNQSDVDGLILVVPASLQPTPFPRVFTSAGELVYGVRDVDPGILSSAGLASFARSVDDAERKLRERGVLKPRVLQASLRNAIELVVTPQVARDMVAADRGAAVFRNARVCVAISR
ncbi:MAG TPA: hypothetical protein VI485_16215 [Vicinamibacterales bacterium]|nr:hypothetical protein [Vicinamibacterales bacterium]